MPLDRSQILEASDLPRELVEVPEWGGSFWVRQFTGAELAEFLRKIVAGDEDVGALIATVAIDEEGQRLFTDEDAPALNAKNGRVLNRIAERILAVNGFSPEALDEGKDDSAATPTEDSSSDSPEN